MKKKYNIPRGYKIWEVVSSHRIGYYTVIAKKGLTVAMFVFDGINDIPFEVWNYNILAK